MGRELLAKAKAKAIAIAIAIVSSRVKSQDKRYSTISSQSITVSFLRRPGRLRLVNFGLFCVRPEFGRAGYLSPCYFRRNLWDM